MKRLVLLFICSIVLANTIVSQPVWTDADNERIMKWDSAYQVETISFRSDSAYENIYQYIVRKGDKIYAEYFRHDDSSFLFIEYDSANKRLQRGLIKLCDQVFDSLIVPIPNFKLDPDGAILKDTTLYEYSYRRNGIWWEKDTVEKVWKGLYKNGLKEGNWKEGSFLCCNETSATINEALYDSFKPYKDHFYKGGINVALYNDANYWPEIKGKWFHKSNIDSKTSIFERPNNSNLYLNFKNSNTLVYNKRFVSRLDAVETEYTSSWKQNGKMIEISSDSHDYILEIVSLKATQLIVRFVKW